jgi:Protein of unknown function (DUF559)
MLVMTAEARDLGRKRIDRAMLTMYPLVKEEAHRVLLRAIAYYLTSRGINTEFGLGEDEPPAENEIGRIFVERLIIGRCKADILVDCHFRHLFGFDPLRIVVEHDGPFHDKPQQYHHDRWRDREMQIQGYLVLRFPANEAAGLKKAFNCAAEVRRAIEVHIQRQEAAGPRLAQIRAAFRALP